MMTVGRVSDVHTHVVHAPRAVIHSLVRDAYRRRRYPTTAAALQERRESEEGEAFGYL